MSDVRGQLTADRQPARKLMRFAQTGPDGSFADIHRVRTETKLIRLSNCVIAAVSPRYLPASFAWRAVASREGCFALARRSCFFRRLARFLALSLPLLCPISRTFARFSSESKASDWDKPTCPPSRQRQGSKVVDASKIWRILYWRQVVSVVALKHLRARRLLLPGGHTSHGD